MEGTTTPTSSDDTIRQTKAHILQGDPVLKRFFLPFPFPFGLSFPTVVAIVLLMSFTLAVLPFQYSCLSALTLQRRIVTRERRTIVHLHLSLLINLAFFYRSRRDNMNIRQSRPTILQGCIKRWSPSIMMALLIAVLVVVVQSDFLQPRGSINPLPRRTPIISTMRPRAVVSGRRMDVNPTLREKLLEVRGGADLLSGSYFGEYC